MPEEADHLNERHQARRWPLTWPGLLALTWFVYELTHQPGLASAAIALKFGWEDFATARWLARTDPNRRRGRVCSWLFFSMGLLKAAFASIAMSGGIAWLFCLLERRNPQVPLERMMLWVGGAAGVYLAASTLAAGCAVVLGWRARCRFWLDRGVHRARRHNAWPPTPWCAAAPAWYGEQFNGASVPILAGGCVLFFASLVAFIVLFPRSPPLSGILVPGGLLAATVAAVHVINWRLEARAPGECWPEPPPGQRLCDDSMAEPPAHSVQ
jgi:hypothetical protein